MCKGTGLRSRKKYKITPACLNQGMRDKNCLQCPYYSECKRENKELKSKNTFTYLKEKGVKLNG